MILLQITVTGYVNTGKTCLINCIMNNEFPYKYRHTDTPMIFYKVYKNKGVKFCVEIEDVNFESDINYFLNMQRKEITKNNNDRNPIFSFFEKPLIPFNINDNYNSISYGKMAYFLVFDLSNPSTFEYIKNIYLKMYSIYNRYYTLKPFICFVGTKYDLVNPDCDIIRKAENFANKYFVQLWLTSAYTGININKLFVHTINMVYSNINLWKYDIDELESPSSEDKD